MNLRTKFHIASACLILTVVVGMMASLFIFEKRRLWAQIDLEQREEMDKLARVFEDAMIEDNEAPLINYVKNLLQLSSPKVAYAGVIHQDGAAWIYSDPSQPLMFVDSTEAPLAKIKTSRIVQQERVEFKGRWVNELSRPVGRIGHVRLGYSEDVVKALFRQTVNKSLERFSVVGLIAIVFGLLLASLFSTALSRPIANLVKGAEAIAKGERGIRIPEGSEDELGRLTKTFNHMSQELIKLDQLKDDFMSHVTHELRSPLTSIIATVELMSEMPMAAKDPKFRRSIDRLVYGSERLNRLVDNILDLTRMEAGKMPFDIQPMNLGKIVSEMADFFEPRAMEKGLKIQAIVPSKLPMALGDAEKVRQVISNLVHNAIKFTNRGGIVIWTKEMDGMLAVGVQDTGVGIPKENLKTVFEKFECLKDTRNRVEKPVPGSGLGLNIVKNSIKSQGGKIWVESEVDKGSTFIFTLPVASAAAQSAQAPVTADAPLTFNSEHSKSMDIPTPSSDKRQPIIMDNNRKSANL